MCVIQDTHHTRPALDTFVCICNRSPCLQVPLMWININTICAVLSRVCSFMWEGIDGTKVLTHFPPCDTYCGQVTVDEMVKTIKNYSGVLSASRS